MTFRILAVELHQTAEAAENFFRTNRGATAFRHEDVVDPRLQLRPTLTGTLPDKALLCVEVSVRAYSNSLDTFVLEAFEGGWPIQLYVAIPDAKEDPEFAGNLRKARLRGVGVVGFEGGSGYVYTEALALSLFGLMPTNPSEFPSRKRQVVALAEQTFRAGKPDKGCQSIYEEIEAITRALAKYSKTQGWFRTPRPGDPKVVKNFDTTPWANVLDNMHALLDYKALKSTCPGVTAGLVAATMDITDPRNQTSHKPKSLRLLHNRDRKLRAWFEQARELLRRWCAGTKPLKL